MELQNSLETKASKALNSNGLDHDVENLKKDFSSLKEHVGSLMGSMQTLVKEKAGEGADKSKDLADEAVGKAKDFQSTVESTIREKPLASVGIALGVGALLAVMTRK